MIIYIIGFMACGKTKTGRALAKSIQYDFIDLDKKIESIHNKSIAELFTNYGENNFRLLEQNALHQTTNLKNTVVSCGGGTPCFFNNMAIINYFGESIYLKTAEELLTERLILKKEKRPLVADKSDAEIEKYVIESLIERSPFYEKAKYIISNSGMKEKSVHQIVEILDFEVKESKK